MTPPTSTVYGFRGWLERLVPPSYREKFYRLVSATIAGLVTGGLLASDKADLWTQLGLSTVTLLFAMLYTTNGWRIALYAVAGPAAGLVMAYGIIHNITWTIIFATIVQAGGVTTAAAKTVQRVDESESSNESRPPQISPPSPD